MFGREAAALEQVAEMWGCGRERARRVLAYCGLVRAMMDEGQNPTRVKIGKGRGSGHVKNVVGEIVEIVPVEQHDIAYLGWLAQAGIRNAREELSALEMAPERPKQEVRWPVIMDPETGEMRESEYAHAVWDDSVEPVDALDALIAAEAAEQAAEELQRRAYERAKKRTREIMDALLDYMEQTGADYAAARKAVAVQLGIRPGTIDVHFWRLRGVDG